MPHAAAIVGGAFICAGALVLLNELVLQPHLERRRAIRREQEEDEELERAIAVSLAEYESGWERQHPVRQSPPASARAAGYSGEQNMGTLRRRRGRGASSDWNEYGNATAYSDEPNTSRGGFTQAADALEMEERHPLLLSSHTPIVPSPPASQLRDEPASSPFHDGAAVNEAFASDNTVDDVHNSVLEGYSILQPSPPASTIADAPVKSSVPHETESQETALHDRFEESSSEFATRSRSSSTSSLDSGITIISLPESSGSGPTYSPAQNDQPALILPVAGALSTISRPISPFSEGADEEFESLASRLSITSETKMGAGTQSSASSSSSGWSDLGEDSSDEDEGVRADANRAQNPFAEPLMR